MDAACIYSVELKVVVITSAPGKANRALIATAIVLSKRRKQRETSPVPPVSFDLLCVNDRSCFWRSFLCRNKNRVDLHMFVGSAHLKSNIQCSGFSDPQGDIIDHLCLELVTRDSHAITPNG